jgi:hypothetical protein
VTNICVIGAENVSHIDAELRGATCSSECKWALSCFGGNACGASHVPGACSAVLHCGRSLCMWSSLWLGVRSQRQNRQGGSRPPRGVMIKIVYEYVPTFAHQSVIALLRVVVREGTTLAAPVEWTVRDMS